MSIDALSYYPAVVYNQHKQKEEWRYKDQNHQIRDLTLNRNFAANTAEMQLEACLQGAVLHYYRFFQRMHI
ncbi:MAG: hypothetical protein ACI9OI_002022 [Chitinophagales bacterium]|jgi:hypothetical protein